MKKLLLPSLFIAVLLAVGCREDEESISPPIVLDTAAVDTITIDTAVVDTTTSDSTVAVDLKGYVQKGPFINGTAITLSELSHKLIATGKNFTTQIVDNQGSFSLKEIKLQSKYVQLQADGFYFDEVGGRKSAAQLTLFALADVSDGSSVNINILSHLERNRVVYLMQEEEKSFTEAKKQAQREILVVFGIAKDSIGYSEQLNISQAGENNGVLLAISAILQANNSVAELSELMANLITDLREDGTLNSEAIRNTLKTQATSLSLLQIRANLENRYAEMGIEATIPPFEQYVDSDGDGILNKDEDDTPEAFEFTSLVDVAINDTLSSNTITVNGLKEGGTADARINGGYLILNGEVKTDTVVQVQNGDQLQLQLISSKAYASTIQASLTIGNFTGHFQITTDDYQPDAFSFEAQREVAIDSFYASNTITVSGLPYPTPAKILNGKLVKNGEEIAGDSTMVINGDQLTVKLLSSSYYSTSNQATLDINGTRVNFEVVTDDYAPNAVSFSPIEDADLKTIYHSDTLSLAGLPYPTPLQITGNGIGNLFINGEKLLSADTLVNSGDQIAIELSFAGIESLEYGTTYQYQVVIGSSSMSFRVTTKANPRQRKADLPDQYDENPFVTFATESKVYVGGDGPAQYPGNANPRNLYEYDIAADQWSLKSEIPTDVYYYTSSCVIEQMAYIIIGANLWEYDTEANQWADKGSLPGSIGSVYHAFAIGNEMYCLSNTQVWTYSPGSNTWTEKANFPFSHQHSEASLVNGKILINIPEGWMYNPADDTWASKQKSDIHYMSRSFTVQGEPYCINAHLYKYEESTDSWTVIEPLVADPYNIVPISGSDKGYIVDRGWLYEYTPTPE